MCRASRRHASTVLTRRRSTAWIASVYDRVVVNDREVIEVELTEDAKRHGLALAMPEQERGGLARPAGARRGLGHRWVAGVAVRLSRLPARQQPFAGAADIGRQVGLMAAREGSVLCPSFNARKGLSQRRR